MPRSPTRRIEIPRGRLELWEPLFERARADGLLDDLWERVDWSQHWVRMGARRLRCPRLSAWYGDRGALYRYSGQVYDPLPWIPPLEEVRRKVEEVTGHGFNAVLLNAYRDGNDSMGWHSDDEKELGDRPVVASVSLGAVRRFRLRDRSREHPAFGIELEHGSLLLMGEGTQEAWQHAVPRTRRPVGLRLNLTLRRIEDLAA
jgi:alkylated DNA repair dioxygenase AlkB